jgi:P4 family phage/plasmid primase-like protien
MEWMISETRIITQIVQKVDGYKLAECRTLSKSQRIGAYGSLLSDAVMDSDVRMYRMEVFCFNGRYYEEMKSEVFDNMLIQIMIELNFGQEIIVNSYKTIIGYVKTRLISADISPSKEYIPFRNVLFNAQSHQIRDFGADINIMYCLDYDYDADAKCPLWQKFLKEVLPKPGLIEILQEYLGLLFVDREYLKLEDMLMLYGSGSNGKSVVYETISGILGENNVSFYEMEDLTTSNTKAYNLAAIDGKILNYCSELSSKDFSGNTMKKLISGESIQAREIYKKPVLLKAIPLFICNANELPETTDKSYGFFRRLLIIPFDVKIKVEDQDKALSTKLRKEYAGILNWILEGRERILRQNCKFTEVNEIHTVKESYRRVQDSVYGFLKANRLSVETAPKHKKYDYSNTSIYAQYMDYCQEAGKKPYGKFKLIEILAKEGFKKYHTSDERGFVFFCDRDPSRHWNKDIGAEYGEEIIEDEPVVSVFEQAEMKFGEKVPF